MSRELRVLGGLNTTKIVSISQILVLYLTGSPFLVSGSIKSNQTTMASRPEGAAQGYIDPNWPPPGEDGDATIIIYGYTPNFALCILALVLFFILGLGHGWQLLKYRTWYFSTMMVGIAFVRPTSPTSAQAASTPHPAPTT